MPEQVKFNHSSLDGLSQGDLLVRRSALIAKGGNAGDLNDSDLEELVAIINQLRRRSSGPPAIRAAKASKQKAPLGDLGSLL